MSGLAYTLDNAPQFVGKELGLSDWMVIDQGRIDAFADATEDHQWIHQAGSQADEGPFGGPVAHGLLALGLTVKFAKDTGALPEDASMCVNYGYERIRFPAPVLAGARVRCRTTLKKVDARDDGSLLLTTEYRVEVEGSEKPAMICDCLGVFYR